MVLLESLRTLVGSPDGQIGANVLSTVTQIVIDLVHDRKLSPAQVEIVCVYVCMYVYIYIYIYIYIYTYICICVCVDELNEVIGRHCERIHT
jgi:hypothetical protein